MGKVALLLAACALLVACGPPPEPTACELERMQAKATTNAVDNFDTYFHALVEDYTKYYKPVCLHGIPYFMETDQSYLDKRGNSQILVPMPEPYSDYSAYFWQACMRLEEAKGDEPPPAASK